MSHQQSPLESSISKAISKAIRTHFPGAIVRKRHVTMGTMGDPDLFGCLPGGRHFEIEVKRPGNNPTPLQDQRLKEWFAAGAITGVARSVEDALQILAKGCPQRSFCCMAGCDANPTRWVKRLHGGEHRHYCEEHWREANTQEPGVWVEQG